MHFSESAAPNSIGLRPAQMRTTRPGFHSTASGKSDRSLWNQVQTRGRQIEAGPRQSQGGTMSVARIGSTRCIRMEPAASV
jgi:hypothetical protein